MTRVAVALQFGETRAHVLTFTDGHLAVKVLRDLGAQTKGYEWRVLAVWLIVLE